MSVGLEETLVAGVQIRRQHAVGAGARNQVGNDWRKWVCADRVAITAHGQIGITAVMRRAEARRASMMISSIRWSLAETRSTGSRKRRRPVRSRDLDRSPCRQSGVRRLSPMGSAGADPFRQLRVGVAGDERSLRFGFHRRLLSPCRSVGLQSLSGWWGPVSRPVNAHSVDEGDLTKPLPNLVKPCLCGW